MPLFEQNITMQATLPQFYGSETEKTIMETSETAIKSIAIGTVIWIVIMQLIASKLIKRVLPLFHTLQCIILIKMFKLGLPGNVNNLLQIVIDTIEMKQVKEYGG